MAGAGLGQIPRQPRTLRRRIREILGADIIGRVLQTRFRLGLIAAKQVPLGDIICSLAFFLGRARGESHFVQRAPPERKIDDRIRPVFGFQPRRIG
jgi:hypothetical protein